MVARDLILDPSEVDLTQVIAGIDEIRKYIPQRFEMEQLTAIVFEDVERGICAGYKQTTEDEFWIRGHMPTFALMPGVLMCEAAAQLASYLTQKYDLLGAEMVGFGGLDDVRFRGMVRPGERLLLICELLKLRRGAMCVCRFQGLVGDSLVCEGKIRGIPLNISAAADK